MPGHVTISLDETATCADVEALASALAGAETSAPCCCETPAWAPVHTRQTPFCTETAFNSYHSETEMMRYIRRLESRDLALNEAMIPLGSCTMKLNAASEMIPITWPETSSLHPFVPADQSEGIREMLSVLSDRLAKITALPPSPSSPTRVRRGNTPACWPSAATRSTQGKATVTSASSQPPPMERTPLPPPWRVLRWCPSNVTKAATSTWRT